MEDAVIANTGYKGAVLTSTQSESESPEIGSTELPDCVQQLMVRLQH